jgi:hypothetical protein
MPSLRDLCVAFCYDYYQHAALTELNSALRFAIRNFTSTEIG